MKGEVVGITAILFAVAAASDDPIAYIATGSLVGSALGAALIDGNTKARAIRLLLTFAFGFCASLAIWGAMHTYGLIAFNAEHIAQIKIMGLQKPVGYVCAFVAVLFNLLAWPVLVNFEKRGGRIAKAIFDKAEKVL